MSVESELKTTLGNASGVTNLVSNRVYPGVAPHDAALPYIVYSKSNREPYGTLTGVGDPSSHRLEIECVAKGITGYSTAKAVAAAVVAALEGDGYLQSEFDLYDDTTGRHSIFVSWSFAD